MVERREILAVVIAAESPLGRVADTVNELTSHLPPTGEGKFCTLCRRLPWPCPGFDVAARRLVSDHRLPIAVLVPLDLHPTLWPSTPSTPERHADRADPGSWFDKEQPHG